ncbi:hypothetical protein [Chitinophaga solisilvae]|uniref:hypothetical protein n=1 Tax=Chitinophaga solisilvae TaxID=1233460 RepID=UPI00136E8FBA|nr:hypothetical protein [Chitinophaga solisilvae]
MKLNLMHDTPVDLPGNINSACMSAADTLTLLLDTGDVVQHQLHTPGCRPLFTTATHFSYKDGSFDAGAPSSIYTMDGITVVVNDFKTHGYLYYPGKYRIHLWREDYHADISRYPIALFRDQQQTPYIIYAVAWNHLQIMNLDTRQVMTAAKSLIEEGAEERHLAFYANYEESNMLPWPRAYDYFFGQLQLSPDNSRFLSAGWAWGSCDQCRVYDVAHFISHPRIADRSLGAWEHNNRNYCWTDNHTIAVTYDPYADEEEGALKDAPGEIHFYDLRQEADGPVRKISVPGPPVIGAAMYYSPMLQALVLHSERTGVVVITPGGEVLYRDETLKVHGYHTGSDMLWHTAGNTIKIWQLTI